MSDSTRISKADGSTANSISEKLNAGIIGLALGAGGTYLAMIYSGYQLDSPKARIVDEAAHAPAVVPPPLASSM